ncbi:MAG TPA: nucleotide sugar dehydrogenase [Terriglobia bacterium]|nr:nucleotide sugar dehydrogenase [Terriglobia bacterium]
MTSRSISIFGLGYVGSVMAACFAHKGNRVVGVDVNPAKVDAINSGHSPIIEERMEDLIAEGFAAERLRATTNVAAAVEETEISFVCVGTPSQSNGKLDLGHIEHVSREIGQALGQKTSPHHVVVRSTILPGSTESIVIPALEAASGKRSGEDFYVIYNPEFMREGTAIADFFQPPYTILGAQKPEQLALIRELYDWTPGRIFETSIRVAEMVKYASNAFHAVKVSFANEMGAVAKRLGVDAEEMAEIFTSDTRLNVSPAYLFPGFAFGGSCLPKDVRALAYCSKEQDLRLPLLDSLLVSNQEHIERAVDLILHTGKKKIGLLGLSFKAGTDDLRESPQVKLVKRLLGEGCQIKIWDPNVALGRLAGANRQYIEEVIPHIGSLLCSEMKEVIESAELIVVGNRGAKKEMIQAHLRPGQQVLDLVNLEKDRRPDAHPSYEGICW